MDEFKPYSKTFIGEVMEGMEQNHSDFMDELEKLLRALKDNKAKNAWEAALYYSEDVMAVYGHLRKKLKAFKHYGKKTTFSCGYKMSRPNVQKILYKNVQLVCLL